MTIDRAAPAVVRRPRRRAAAAVAAGAALLGAWLNAGQALALTAPLTADELPTVSIATTTPLIQENIKDVGTLELQRSQTQTLRLPANTTAGILSGPLQPLNTPLTAGTAVAYIVYSSGDVVAPDGNVSDLPANATPVVLPTSGSLTAYLAQNNTGDVTNTLVNPGAMIATYTDPNYTSRPLQVSYSTPGLKTLTTPAFGTPNTSPNGYLYVPNPALVAPGTKITTVNNPSYFTTNLPELQCITDNTCQIVAFILDQPNVSSATPTCSGVGTFKQCPFPITLPAGATLLQLIKSGGALINIGYPLGTYALDGDAAPGVDYVPMPGTATFPIGASSINVEVIPQEDNDPGDGNEVLTVTLLPDDGYLVGSSSTATVTLVETPTITVTATPATLASGQTVVTPGKFTISRSGDTSQPLPIDLTLGGTAVNGTDYSLSGTDFTAPARVTIPAGQGSSTVTVTPIATDTKVKQVTVTGLSLPLTAPTGGYLSGPFAKPGSPVPVGKPVAYIVPAAGDVVAAAGSASDLPTGAVPVQMPQFGTGSEGTVTTFTFVQNPGDSVQSGQRLADLVVDQQTSLAIADTQVSPAVTIVPNQGGGDRRFIVTGDGNVTARAAVTDANPGDSATYDWSASDNALTPIGGTNNATFVFDPSALTPGFYRLRVKVTDSTDRSTEAALLIKVAASLPNLDKDSDLDDQGTHPEDPVDDIQDSDGDGVPDATEGWTDSDNDGIPDWQDASTLPAYALQEMPLVADEFLITTEPGLAVSQGDVAFEAGNGSADVTAGDIAQYGGPAGGAGVNATAGAPGDGPYVDFVVSGLVQEGMSANVVVTQQKSLPAGAKYRIYHPGSGWRDFVQDANNKLASCCGQGSLDQYNSGQGNSTTPYGNTGNYPGSNGSCPAAGSSAYTPGLSQGALCVQLTIQDGGPNDTDGTANHVITDPAGVIGTASGGGSGGGGVLNLPTLAALAGIYLAARQRPKKRGR